MSVSVLRRQRERIVFGSIGDTLSISFVVGDRDLRLNADDILDINCEGIALKLREPMSSAQLAGLKTVSFYWRQRKIGVRPIVHAILQQTCCDDFFARLKLIYQPPYARVYIPAECFERIGPNLYRLRDGQEHQLDARFIRSVLGFGSDFLDSRMRDRLRVAMEDPIRADLRFASHKAAGLFVSDLSPRGVGLLANGTGASEIFKGKPTSICFYFQDRLLQCKEIQKLTIIPVEVRGQQVFKITAQFRRSAGVHFEAIASLFYRESRMMRLIDKALYPSIIRTMVSDTEDLVFGIASDQRTKNEIYELRYQSYFDEGKIDVKSFPTGAMSDKFDSNAIHVSVSIYGAIVAAARLIPDHVCDRFELEESLPHLKLRKPGVRYAEVSRFWVSRLFRADVNRGLALTLRLTGEICRLGWKLGIDRFLITAYGPHIKLYQAIGFKVVSNLVKLRGFNYQYVVMEWDLDVSKTAGLYRGYLLGIRDQIAEESKKYNATKSEI